LRKQCAENDEVFKRLEKEKTRALALRDAAVEELNMFGREVGDNLRFLQSQMERFAHIAEVTRTRSERRERQAAEKREVEEQRTRQRLSVLAVETEEKEREARALATQLDTVNDRLRYYERRFQQIAAATGLTEPDAIANKWAPRTRLGAAFCCCSLQRSPQVRTQG
jgi:wyosine [tRNA(Phe)-imidazoG37] synthetase (radical SAM superfamily)